MIKLNKTRITALTLATFITSLMVVPALAAHEVSIDCETSGILVALSIDFSGIDYPPQEVGATDIEPESVSHPVINNMGTVPCDVAARGSKAESISGGQTWDLGTTAGPLKYAHRVTIDPTWTDYQQLGEGNYEGFLTNMEEGAGQTMLSRYDSPTDYNGDLSVHTFAIQLLATEH